MIFDGNYKKNQGSVVVIVETLNHLKKPIMAAIHINKKNRKINELASYYSKTRNAHYRKWIEFGKLIWHNPKSKIAIEILNPRK